MNPDGLCVLCLDVGQFQLNFKTKRHHVLHTVHHFSQLNFDASEVTFDDAKVVHRFFCFRALF